MDSKRRLALFRYSCYTAIPFANQYFSRTVQMDLSANSTTTDFFVLLLLSFCVCVLSHSHTYNKESLNSLAFFFFIPSSFSFLSNIAGT